MSSKNLGPTLISDTFKHLLQVRDTDKTIFDGDGDLLDDFRLRKEITENAYNQLDKKFSVKSAKQKFMRIL